MNSIETLSSLSLNSGKTSRAEIPAAIRAHCAGPNLTATVSFLSGCLHASKRAIEDTCDALFGVPLALGTISNLEAETSAALQAPHAEALAAVRAAPVKNVDETGWAKQGRLCWLWLAATTHPKSVTIRTLDGESHRFEGGKIQYDLTYSDTLVVTTVAGQHVFDVGSIVLIVLGAN